MKRRDLQLIVAKYLDILSEYWWLENVTRKPNFFSRESQFLRKIYVIQNFGDKSMVFAGFGDFPRIDFGEPQEPRNPRKIPGSVTSCNSATVTGCFELYY